MPDEHHENWIDALRTAESLVASAVGLLLPKVGDERARRIIEQMAVDQVRFAGDAPVAPRRRTVEKETA